MTQRRQSFRSRFPWPFAPFGKSNTEPIPHHPKDRTKKIPTNSYTNVPIKRSTLPPKEALSDDVPKKQSPSHSQHTSSHPGSPSRVSIASSSPKTRPQSPSHSASDGIVEVAVLANEESVWPASSAFEQEKEKEVLYEPMPQEADLPKVSLPGTTFRPESMSIQPQGSQQEVPPGPSSPVSKTEPVSDQPPHPSSPSAPEHTSEVLRPNAEESTFRPEIISIQSQGSQQEAPPVPSTPVSRTESAYEQPPHPSSPLASEHNGEVLRTNAEESNSPASPASREEKEKMVEAMSEPMPQEIEPKMKSPLKTVPKSPETTFRPESMSIQPQDFEQQASSLPSSPISRTEPVSDWPPPLLSSSASKHTNEVLRPNAEESTFPASPASQEEKEKTIEAMSEQMPQEIVPKMKSPSKTIPRSPETSFQHEGMSKQPQPQGSQQQQASSPVSKAEPALNRPPRPSSPLASKPNEESTLPSLSSSQEEKEKTVEAMSEPMLQKAEPKMKSPLKTVPKSPEASSTPSSPVSRTEPTSNDPPHPSSPSASDSVSESLNPSAEKITLPASQGEKDKLALAPSKTTLQEIEPKMWSPMKTLPKSPEISSKPENLSKQHTPVTGNKERSVAPETEKLDLDSATESSKAPSETQSKLLEPEENDKEVHEPVKARKAKDIASTSGTKAKDPFTGPFRTDRKRHWARETVERKIMFAASKLSEKNTRFASSEDPGTRNVSSIPLGRSVSSDRREKARLQQGIKGDISKFVHKLANVDPMQPVDEDKQFSVITLAGDSRGATMQLASELAKANLEESAEATTDVEENTEKDSRSLINCDRVGKAYVNSNIQSINNSLMVHGSITEKDPSV